MDFNEFKERVRAASDITDVVGRYVTLKKSGSSYKGLCPFHHEKTPSFYVMPDDQFFYCHGCHKGGDVFTFLCDLNNMDFTEALEELARGAGIDMPESFDTANAGDRPKRGMKGRFLEMYRDAAEIYYQKLHSEEGKKAFDYLKERGITPNMMTAFGLGYAPGGGSLYGTLKSKGYNEEELKESGLFSYKTGKPADIFYNRVMFPIMNKSSRVIAFGGRVMGDGNPKYINSPETIIYSKKDNLYGMHRAVRAKNNRIILVEGYMDVIAAQQAGFTESCASLGTALTAEQARLIARLAAKVYLIYDTDGAGTKAMLRAIPILRSEGLFVNVADMSPYKDPDELIKAEGSDGFEKRLEQAENAFFFEIRELAKEYNLDDPAERAGFEEKTAEQIAGFGNKFEREQYINAISERFRIDKDILSSEVSRIGNNNRYGTGISYRVRTRQEPFDNTGDNTAIPVDEKNILCALVRSPEYLSEVQSFISPDDFSEGLMQDLANVTFTGIQRGGITVAEIMDSFSDEERDKIGKVFFNDKFDDSDDSQKRQFLSDSVLALLRRRTDMRLASCTRDMQEEYREISAKKKEIDNCKSIFK